MPKESEKSFIYDNKIVKYQYYQGYFQARQETAVADELFSACGKEWLKMKKPTIKSSTYQEYERSFRVDLEPTFGRLRLSKITRAMVREYLFKFVEEKKFRIAKKLKLLLTYIFDMAVEITGFPRR